MNSDILHAIVVVSNPAKYKRRYELFEKFVKKYKNFNPRLRLHTAELQQGDKPFMTSATHKFRTNHELWHKENLINLTVQRLPKNWKYLAWIDADIVFSNERWVEDTIEALQHFKVVQMFQHLADMGPNGEILSVYQGFGYYVFANSDDKKGFEKDAHTGNAWAITRRAYNKIGGLIEFGILGSGDYHMAMAFIGVKNDIITEKLHDNYKLLCEIFEERCAQYINRNIGYVPGTAMHSFHGNKKNRFYQTRWHILARNQFDPIRDIYKDAQGLWQLTNEKPQLRDDIRRYFRSRNEDSIDNDK